MRRFSTAMAAAFAIVAFSSMAFAQSATPMKTPEKTVEKTATKTEKVATTAALSAMGKVGKVDEANRTFTVATKAGEKDFMLGAHARITAGAKTEKMADMAGKTVKVTYTMADGKNVASKVTIASELKPATQVAKKTEKENDEK
jgi:hypothetical protein